MACFNRPFGGNLRAFKAEALAVCGIVIILALFKRLVDMVSFFSSSYYYSSFAAAADYLLI
jgi:hypothetical protein